MCRAAPCTVYLQSQFSFAPATMHESTPPNRWHRGMREFGCVNYVNASQQPSCVRLMQHLSVLLVMLKSTQITHWLAAINGSQLQTVFTVPKVGGFLRTGSLPCQREMITPLIMKGMKMLHSCNNQNRNGFFTRGGEAEFRGCFDS